MTSCLYMNHSDIYREQTNSYGKHDVMTRRENTLELKLPMTFGGGHVYSDT